MVSLALTVRNSLTLSLPLITGLGASARKMLLVLLTETLQKCFYIKTMVAALEAVWMRGFNKIKNIRHFRKEFMENEQVPRGMAWEAQKDLPLQQWRFALAGCIVVERECCQQDWSQYGIKILLSVGE